MTKAEKQISDLRYKMREISAVGQNEEKKRMKREGQKYCYLNTKTIWKKMPFCYDI